MYWPLDKKWYKGKLSCYRAKKRGGKTMHVLYDDGEKEWVNLRKEKFELIGPNPTESASSSPSPKRRRKGKRGRTDSTTSPKSMEISEDPSLTESPPHPDDEPAAKSSQRRGHRHSSAPRTDPSPSPMPIPAKDPSPPPPEPESHSPEPKKPEARSVSPMPTPSKSQSPRVAPVTHKSQGESTAAAGRGSSAAIDLIPDPDPYPTSDNEPAADTAMRRPPKLDTLRLPESTENIPTPKARYIGPASPLPVETLQTGPAPQPSPDSVAPNAYQAIPDDPSQGAGPPPGNVPSEPPQVVQQQQQQTLAQYEQQLQLKEDMHVEVHHADKRWDAVITQVREQDGARFYHVELDDNKNQMWISADDIALHDATAGNLGISPGSNCQAADEECWFDGICQEILMGVNGAVYKIVFPEYNSFEWLPEHRVRKLHSHGVPNVLQAQPMVMGNERGF